jgi:GNAT superfamily N-acetyltransferase
VSTLSVEKLEIRNVNLETLDDLVNICVSPDRRHDPLLIIGMNAKKEWAAQVIKMYGSIAKLAYLNSKPVGMIQYTLNPEERLVEIKCIYVPEKENLGKGIGKSLLNALIEDMKKPKSVFKNDIPLAIVTSAFQVPGEFSQHEFYLRMGFKKASEGDPFFLYYPLKKEYVPASKERKFIPQEEDYGKALIFFDPSCPFSAYFSEKIKESVKEVAPNVSIRIVDKFKDEEDVKKRGYAPYCVVNGRSIETFFRDKEKFQKEVKQALEVKK